MVNRAVDGGIVQRPRPRRGWFWRLTACAAGPLVALQLLLAGIVAVQMAAELPPDPSVICYGAGQPDADDPASGAGHAVHTACAICAFAALAPLLASGSPAQLLRNAFARLSIDTALPAAVATLAYSPRSSQGPPQSA